MGRTLYAYDDRYWEAIETFTYTGEAREFTIDPGEYLFICNGAAGGGTDPARHWGYGATAYGIFETDQTETLYAVVGGNGVGYANSVQRQPTPGGFNGGGDGGYNTSNSVLSGGSGGGASDIRLTMDDTLVPPHYQYNLPPEFLELEDLHLQWEEWAYINTGFYPTLYSRFEMTMRFSALASERKPGWRIPFGTRRQDNGVDEQWLAIRNSSNLKVTSKSAGETLYEEGIMPYDEKVFISYNSFKKKSSYLSESGKTYEFTHTRSVSANASYPLMLFTLNNWGSPGDYIPHGMKFYDFKIYEQDPNGVLDDELIHHYIPAERLSDNMVGVYDLIDQTFIAYTPYSSGHRMFGKRYPSNSRTLLSRILVAGGGGGDGQYNTYGYPMMAYGGGRTAGFVGMKNNSNYSHNDLISATQDEGYAFGKGANGWAKPSYPSYGAEGAGGGGGGWFGGYTEDHYNASYSSIHGSGGSSYALTADSWKPYGYIPTSHYYLKKPALVSCQTTEGSILICKEVSLINGGDTIVAPFTGYPTKLTLFPGTYGLKCYGGEGGQTIENGTSFNRFQGGYSEGTLNLNDKRYAYAVVGGSGLFARSIVTSSKFEFLNELASYNGGGTTITAPLTQYHIPWNGGGGTDIRLTMDETPAHPTSPDPDTRDDIPEGYTQLKSIYTNGANPFESEVIVTPDTEFIYDFKIDTGVSGSYPTVFGTDDGPNSHSFVLFAWNAGSGHLALDGGGIDIGHLTKGHRLVLETQLSTADMTVIIHDKDEGIDYTYRGNRSLLVGTSSGLTFNCLKRGGYSNQINNTTYGIKFKVNGVITHDFVPCRRNMDNVVGLYDVITGSFKTYNSSSQNTGAPLADVSYPSKTLLSRILVAGGAGGYGYNSGYPGKGGGLIGGTIQNGYGENPGPGTQASSPQSVSHPEINGGFGYGGKGISPGWNGRGGAGGGGWFGGSGTYPDTGSDNDKGGAGGSGYVLTESSYKPEYYSPTEEWYLSDASTTLGGNTLAPNITKVEIDVITAYCSKMMIYDIEGYKGYDVDSDSWTMVTPGPITPELIEEYGVYMITSLNGVRDSFDVVVDDPQDIITGVSVSNSPLAQEISFLVPKRHRYSREVIDAVYDNTVYDMKTLFRKYDNEYNAYVVSIDKLTDSDDVFKLYSINLFAN